MKRPIRPKEHAINSMMKKKKAELVAAHKMKHPADPALYRRTKREIAAEIIKQAWWPVRDFPVTIEDEKNVGT